MCQHLLRQNLTQLYPFLVKTVDIPYKALIHNLVLEMGQERPQRFGCQLLTDNDAGRTAALKILIAVLIRLAAGKCHNLRRHIGTEFLLAGVLS